jgi:hypothetical protein
VKASPFVPEWRICQNAACGQNYWAGRVNQRYCSRACRPAWRSGNATARGYGAEHQAERERWRPTVEAGDAWCAEVVCLMPTRWIDPAIDEWDLAHTVDRTAYLGPAHVFCNRTEPQLRDDGDDLIDLVDAVGPPRRWVL